MISKPRMIVSELFLNALEKNFDMEVNEQVLRNF